MHITLLGTGTPILDPRRQPAGLLIELEKWQLLFDAGPAVTGQLIKGGFQPQRIDCLFLTHHHYDHIGGLGELLLAAWHNGRDTPFDVYGPPGTRDIITALLDQVYARDIAFARFTEPDGPDIREMVRVQEITPGLVYRDNHYRVLAEHVDHGHGLGLSQADWPCFGYRLEAEEKVVAISGDTVACAGLDRLAEGADVLIQCCYLAEAEITTPAREQLARHIIACSGQVGQIATHNRVKKLVLTHIRPKSDLLLQALLTDVRQDYAGELVLGEDLMRIEV